MYQGLRNTELQQLVEKLEQEKLQKRDLVIPSTCMSVQDGMLKINDLPEDMFHAESVKQLLSDFGIESPQSSELLFEPTDVARVGIATKLHMNMSYYRYLEDKHLDLLDYNLSELLKRDDRNFFVRTFAPTDEGTVGLWRTFLSDRYQVVDNLDVLYSALQAIKETGADVKIGKCNLTEKRMYVEFLRPEANITAQEYLNRYNSPSGGDDGQIYAGFVISNSEVGEGAYKIVPRAIVGACENGLVFKRDAMRKTHLGTQMDEGIQWSQRTRDKELELIKSQMVDAVSAFMSTDFLEQKLQEMSQHTDRLEHPTQATENVCKELGISKEEKANVLNYFIDGGDFSPVGVVQAVTYHAHEQEDADKQYELEANAIDILPDIAGRLDYNSN